MAMIKVLSDDAADIGAATKTHAVIDGTLLDIVNPLSLPGDTTTAMLKSGAYALAGWVGRGYRDNKSFSL